MLEMNMTIAFPAAPLLTVILALVGKDVTSRVCSGSRGSVENAVPRSARPWLVCLPITRQKTLECDGTVSCIVLLPSLEKRLTWKSQKLKLCHCS